LHKNNHKSWHSIHSVILEIQKKLLTHINVILTDLGLVFKSIALEDFGIANSKISKATFTKSVQAVNSSVHHNGWFTKTEVKRALTAWNLALQSEKIENWTSSFSTENSVKKKVGLVCAGNIPLVGLHDLLCVLAAEHEAVLKLSSKDSILMMMCIEILKELHPNWSNSITVNHGKLDNIDFVIATGSDNSARYFKYYFNHIPHIIRKNRTSVAILDGKETDDDLIGLGNDIFSYYGLGCRNVTKLYLPRGYDLDVFFKGIFSFKDIVNHNKYANNYDYHRAVWLMNQEPLLENGFLLLKESSELTSPVGSLFYEFYDDKPALKASLVLQMWT